MKDWREAGRRLKINKRTKKVFSRQTTGYYLIIMSSHAEILHFDWLDFDRFFIAQLF